jgi:hypothetical protein
MNRKLNVAAAVATALSSGASMAGPPSITDINFTPDVRSINIVAARTFKAALTNSILANFCNGAANATLVTSDGSSDDFVGIACTRDNSVDGGTYFGNYNIWIRFLESGAAYLALINGVAIKEIDGPTLYANPITVDGTPETSDATDSYFVAAGGSLSWHSPDLVIGDLEPASLVGNNYPTDYCTAVWGPRNDARMYAQGISGQLVDVVYALYVNEQSPVFTETPLVLNQQTVANILTGQIRDWSQVFDTSSRAVTHGSLPITIVNREYGSGSRAAIDILLVGDKCSSAGINTTVLRQSAQRRYFSTFNVLKAANTVPGAITYASIDNFPGTGNQTNLSWVSLNGVAPNSLAAAQGRYSLWVEAAYINNAPANGHDSAAVNSIVSMLQNQGTTAGLPDFIGVPYVMNALSNPSAFNTSVHIDPALTGRVPSGGGNATVYINPFTRGGATCSNPAFSANELP